MFIALLGRQPEISLTELEAVFGTDHVKRIANQFAQINTATFNIDELGGTIKCAEIIKELPLEKHDKASLLSASRFINNHYSNKWRNCSSKITLGISSYNLNITPRDLQKTGLILKKSLKQSGASLRLIPNEQLALSTATAHNNKLGSSDNKVELLIVRTNKKLLIAESRGVQNITSYTKRDHSRPRRDAFVGMLPPKLAQIMINLSGAKRFDCVWDPFCGTGTVLQEARLKEIDVYGSDLNQKMVDYSSENMKWFDEKFGIGYKNNYQIDAAWKIFQADATTVSLDPHQKSSITHIVCETYLGLPFSTPPKPEKLHEVSGNCNHIISEFLKNIHNQIQPNTKLCIAVPAWRDNNDSLTHLPLLKNLKKLGFSRLNQTDLIYHRPNQVVAREILVLKPIKPLDISP